ncbi:MAG: nucleotide exchange factor GrpE [Verrucomicrobia bacterium]|nr:nucleotide exchange factor GrpE [Verrucomicrobiota bacterium]
MTDRLTPKLPKWPFLLGDILLVAVAVAIVFRGEGAFDTLEIAACVVSVALGAWFCVTPFLKEYRTASQLAENNGLADTLTQIQNLENVGAQIATATSQWQNVQEQSSRTAAAAKEIAEHIAAESKSFSEFLQKANEQEKNHLRLEVEKLRRAEGDWLQIVVRLLDHIYALNVAAGHSGQPNLIEQLGNFQNACREVVRRVGLVPFVIKPGEAFDAKIHQLPDPETNVAANAQVAETLATGFTFQGQLLRPAIVNLQPGEPSARAEIAPSSSKPAAPLASEPTLL